MDQISDEEYIMSCPRIPVEVGKKDTIAAVRAGLKVPKSVPKKFDLFFKDVKLADTDTLNTKKIKKGAVINAVYKEKKKSKVVMKKKSKTPDVTQMERLEAPSKLRVCGYAPYTAKGGDSANPLNALSTFKLAFNEARSVLKAKYKSERKDVSTLQLFMAPEWSFRKPDTEIEIETVKTKVIGLWAADELAVIIKGLMEISEKEPDMLIVAGSILWAIPGKVEFGVNEDGVFTESMDVSMVYNTIPVLCGGKVIHFYHKQHEGLDVDVKNGQVFAFDAKSEARGTKVDITGLQTVTDRFRTKPVDFRGKELKAVVANTFEHAGLKFGLEICADHSSSTLGKALGGKNGTDESGGTILILKESKRVDVQLVVSCGMNLSKKSIAVRKGGAALHVDGSSAKLAAFKMSCFGFTNVDEEGNYAPAKNLARRQDVYKDEHKTFFGTRGFVYDNLIELVTY